MNSNFFPTTKQTLSEQIANQRLGKVNKLKTIVKFGMICNNFGVQFVGDMGDAF